MTCRIIVWVRATGQTGVVKCVARPAVHMPKTGQGHSVHTNFDRRKLMTLNNRRSVVVLPIFTTNTLLERACFELNENVLVLKMKQGTVKWQGFKVGQSVGLAAPVRERNVDVGGQWTSAIPSFHVWYSKLKYPSREDASNNVLNLKITSNIKPVGTFFFIAMLNWIAASPVNCTEGESGDNWHWFRGSSRPSV